jgi:hypothetical protein
MELVVEVAGVSTTDSRPLSPSVPIPMVAVSPVAPVAVGEVPEADMSQWKTATPARVLFKTTLTSVRRTTLKSRRHKDWIEGVDVVAVVVTGSVAEVVGEVHPSPTPSE